MIMPIPLCLLAAAVVVALVLVAACAWVGRREEAEYPPYPSPLSWKEHPPP